MLRLHVTKWYEEEGVEYDCCAPHSQTHTHTRDEAIKMCAEHLSDDPIIIKR